MLIYNYAASQVVPSRPSQMESNSAYCYFKLLSVLFMAKLFFIYFFNKTRCLKATRIKAEQAAAWGGLFILEKDFAIFLDPTFNAVQFFASVFADSHQPKPSLCRQLLVQRCYLSSLGSCPLLCKSECGKMSAWTSLPNQSESTGENGCI